ncbi:gliding motility lipoprotein GldD [Urechidicola sp. KH5]
MKFSFFWSVIAVLLIGCQHDPLPKPRAELKLEYPMAKYNKVLSACPYTFEISREAVITFENNCEAQIKYPDLKATVFLTYRQIQNGLPTALQEVERLTYEHAIKADAIDARPFENDKKSVYGKLVYVEGNVASNVQFHVTDSIENLLYGALYFEVQPNYDSILPAVKYIENDIRNLMESVTWQE